MAGCMQLSLAGTGSGFGFTLEGSPPSNFNLGKFCIDTTKEITATNMEPDGLALPVYMDYYYEDGNYYSLVVNNTPGGLVRLNFGNSLLNFPTTTELGDFDGIICNSAQGIKIVKANNRILALITGGDPNAGYRSRIIKLDFGESITNIPKATNWGNPGRLLNYPHDIYLFEEPGGWYGLTVNYFGGAIIRLFFGSDFTEKPVAENLGSKNMAGPTSMFPIVHEGTSYLFVTNYDNHTITRIDFGSSFRNKPSASLVFKDQTGAFSRPRDIQIFNDCERPVGYVINGGTDDLVQLTLSSGLVLINTTIISNVGGLNTPQSFSPVFYESGVPYIFAPNVSSNSINILRFPVRE